MGINRDFIHGDKGCQRIFAKYFTIFGEREGPSFCWISIYYCCNARRVFSKYCENCVVSSNGKVITTRHLIQIWQSSSLQMAWNIPNKTWDGGWIISIFSQVKYSTFYIKTLLQVWKISQLSGESLTKKLKEIFYNLKSLLLLPEQMYIIHKSIIAKVEKLLTFMRKVLSRFLFSVLRRYLQKSWVKRKWTTWM